MASGAPTTIEMRLAKQLATVWKRWCQRCVQQQSSSSTPTAQHTADDETQYELIAVGLAATLSDAQLQELFTTSSERAHGGALTLLLPLQPAFAQDPQQFHFTLVVIAKLLTHYLELESVSTAQAPQWLRIVDELLLPLLRHQRYACVHSVALAMLKQIVHSTGAAIAETLACEVSAMLMDESSSESSTADQLESVDTHDVHTVLADTTDNEHAVSFSALCGALQLLLEQSIAGALDADHASQSLPTSAATIAAQTQQVCVHAIARFDTAPLFLRAVSTQLVPTLLRLSPASAHELSAIAVDAWRAAQHDRRTSIANVMYLLCVLLPSEPELLRERGLQEITAFALAHSDALLRKQGMYLLNIAFTHYALLTEGRGGDSSNSTDSAVLETWQHFITASDVIHMHEQLHLIEQVWPQVTKLLESSLVVVCSNNASEPTSPSASPPSAAAAAVWPVTMSFDWVQSLLIRVFSHENPLVRRTFMQSFMETCLAQWHITAAAAIDTIDADASFACSASFHTFVFEHLLRSVNDPQMYKTSTKAAFQRAVTEFLAAYLAFQLARGGARAVPATQLLPAYIDAVHDAIFGPDVSGHSPEALVSMLEVFGNAELQTAVQVLSEPLMSSSSPSSSLSLGDDLLNENAVDRLRMIMEFRVMRSFPQSIRLKITCALVHALTDGFTRTTAHSLRSLTNILLVLPLRNVVGDDGSTYVRIHRWLQPLPSDGDSSHDRFASSLRVALTQYLSARDDVSAATRALSPDHLSRLLLFTSDVTQSASERTDVELRTPLAHFVAAANDAIDSRKLLRLVGKFEEDVAQVVELASAPTTRTRFHFTFVPHSVYAADDAHSLLRSSTLFQLGLREFSQWLDVVTARTTDADSPHGDDDDELDGATLKEDAMELLSATALVVTQMATYAMEQDGDVAAMDALNGVCASLLRMLSPAMATRVSPSEQTLAITYLSVVASRATAIDSLHALQGETALPLLLSACLNASARRGSQLYARCSVRYFVSRWTLLHSVLLASSYVSTELLRRVVAACLESLPAVGADPHVLYELVQVLALALTQLAATFVHASGDDREQRLDELFRAVWGEYSACLAKPDALTRAVVYCLFQPAFLLVPALCVGERAPLKRWFHRVLTFGRAHRPNVVFHLTCRVAQVWRAHTHAALWFVDEITTLLLYKEPVLDEKEQLTPPAPRASDDADRAVAPVTTGVSSSSSTSSSGLLVKDKFVRLVVLSLLDDMSVDVTSASAGTCNELQLLQTLIVRLLELNLTPDWCKQHMLNSDGFGQKIRCWQALCVLSKHVSADMVERVNRLLWRAFVFPHLPAMRYYMELFAMQLVLRFPHVTLRGHVVPLLREFNLMPQVGASLLLVAGYAVHVRLDATLAHDPALCALLVDAMLPWLNASHGHTRILVQFMLAVVLPRFLHQHEVQAQQAQLTAPTVAADTSDTDTATTTVPPLSRSDVHLLQQTAAFLSQNKETKRMHRRQLAQLRKFRPEHDCSLLGVLSSAHVNDFRELLPRDDALVFSAQFKHAMNELHAQFNRENFADDTVAQAAEPVVATTTTATTAASRSAGLNVQRKIDTSAILLDDRVLPVAMQERGASGSSTTTATANNNTNERNRPRQPVILCASLVDKTPNLAGLARTCEIFNAQALVVPNARVCDDEMFATISVTASKWVPIEQVRPDRGELIHALQRWKSDGYTIVALEQTASSVCLSSFAFPEKIVIVLGKEKEGVPVDVLQMVDICVEIPQFGLIRSLNVHVSGAILLWEYTQQRMLQQHKALGLSQR